MFRMLVRRPSGSGSGPAGATSQTAPGLAGPVTLAPEPPARGVTLAPERPARGGAYGWKQNTICPVKLRFTVIRNKISKVRDSQCAYKSHPQCYTSILSPDFCRFFARSLPSAPSGASLRRRFGFLCSE